MIIGCTVMGNDKTRFSVFAGLNFFLASIIDEKMMEVQISETMALYYAMKNGNSDILCEQFAKG